MLAPLALFLEQQVAPTHQPDDEPKGRVPHLSCAGFGDV
jgi:hypothetical protein